MELSIRQYTADSFAFARRIGAVWHPCLNFMPAKEAWKYVKPMQALLLATGGLGLAANQVDLDIPLFILKSGKELQPCYRPRVLKKLGKLTPSIEMCLSFPWAALEVYRYPHIVVDFIAFPNNKRLQLELYGKEAVAFQHEMDHLNGITIFHHYGKEKSPLFTSEQAEEQASKLILT